EVRGRRWRSADRAAPRCVRVRRGERRDRRSPVRDGAAWDPAADQRPAGRGRPAHARDLPLLYPRRAASRADRTRPRRPSAATTGHAAVKPAMVDCIVFLLAWSTPAAQTEPHAQAQPRILGDLVDVSEEVEQPDQIHFVGSRVTQFDPATGLGVLRWDRYMRQPSYSFNKMDMALARAGSNEFPGTEYDRDPALPFEITFVSPRTVRLRFFTRDLPPAARRDTDSLMLAGPVPTDRSWKVESGDSIVRYTSAYGELRLIKNPWHIELYDAAGDRKSVV